MKLSTILNALVLVLAFSAHASAHPGHGVDGGSHLPSHYVTDPTHMALISVAAMAVLAALLWKLSGATRKQANI